MAKNVKRSTTHMKCAMESIKHSFWTGVTNILTKASKYSAKRSEKACEKEHDAFKQLIEEAKSREVKTEG